MLHQQAGRGGRLTELEHHPIARRQRADQRTDGQVQRVVPRHDDPDHAQRLVNHFGRSRLESGAHLASRGSHPALEVFAGVMDAVQAGHQFGEQGFIGAAMAEVLADRIDQGLAFIVQQIL
ncbi:hypothetical protein D3C81_1194860 [compost metagenome]